MPDGLYMPEADIEQLAQDTHKTFDETRNAVLTAAADLHKLYSSGGSKSYWSPAELVAINVLFVNRCMRRSVAERAVSDLNTWEAVMEPFPDRLHKMLTEKKYTAFKEYIAKMKRDVTAMAAKGWETMRVLVQKCKNWADATPKTFDTPEDEQMHKMFSNMRTQLPQQLQDMLSKRLELCLNEMEKAPA
jgi:hypothetical protein